MNKGQITMDMLDDPPFIAAVLRQLLLESPDNSIQLTLMGFNSQLGFVPWNLSDKSAGREP